MKPYLILLAGALLSVGYFFVYYDTNNPVPLSEKESASSGDSRPPVLADGVEIVESDLSAAEQEDYWLNHPKVTDYFKKLDAGEKLRKNFAELDQLDKPEIDAFSESVMADIAEDEVQGFISGSEATFLKLALMEKILPQEEFIAYSKKTIDEYKARAEASRIAYKNRHDPQFNAYKQRESEIVKEILQMEVFPDGLTREQYLRQRLDEVRMKIYAGEINGG